MAQLPSLRHNNRIMPKIIPQEELEAILDAVSQFTEGATVEGVRSTLNNGLSRRTLQRRLAQLVDENRLNIEGKTKVAAIDCLELRVKQK